MSLHLIPEDQIEKNGLGDPGKIVVKFHGGKIELPRQRKTKTPFTGYNIIERDGKLYVEIPDGIDKIFPE
jgi:hypothetical protein